MFWTPARVNMSRILAERNKRVGESAAHVERNSNVAAVAMQGNQRKEPEKEKPRQEVQPRRNFKTPKGVKQGPNIAQGNFLAFYRGVLEQSRSISDLSVHVGPSRQDLLPYSERRNSPLPEDNLENPLLDYEPGERDPGTPPNDELLDKSDGGEDVPDGSDAPVFNRRQLGIVILYKLLCFYIFFLDPRQK